MKLGSLIGRGNTAEVFEIGDNEVLKLFFQYIPIENIEKELAVSNLIGHLGIPSPNAKQLVEHQQRWGIIFEKAKGESFTQILSSQPFSLRKNAHFFAELQASYHNKSSDQLPSQKASLYHHIARTELLSQKEKETILDYLSQLPDDNKVCHGDYHSDNIILQDGIPKILDWMTGTLGNPCGDVARTYMIMRYASLPQGMPKIEKISIQLFRLLFSKYYLDSYIKLTGTSIGNIQYWLLPVMAARLNEGIPEHEKHLLLKKIREKLNET